MIDLHLLSNVYSAAHSSVVFKYPDIPCVLVSGREKKWFAEFFMVLVEINAIFIQKKIPAIYWETTVN